MLLRALVAFLSVALSAAAAGAREPWPAPPGVVVASSPEPRTDFIGSPSLVILADGSYVASHDFFGKDARRLHSTRIFRSTDRGATWTQAAELKRQFWSTLFTHRGSLYLLGCEGEYEDIVIRRSDDGGLTWTTPRDERSGRLLRGHFHCAPVPVVTHGGRVWRAFEEYTGPDGKWSGRYFKAFVLSAPAEADLLVADNWRRSTGLNFDGNWVPGERTGWLEGNIVVTPTGQLANLMRLQANWTPEVPFELPGAAAAIPRYEVGALLSLTPDGRTLSFAPETGLIHFPGSQSKFTVRRDPRTGRYWSLVQKITAPGRELGRQLPSVQRNVLVLTTSTDLRQWEERSTVLRWREGEKITSKARVGFQYVDWQFDGDDLVAVCRTAWDAENYHNTNLVTFHRIANFRTLTPADSTPPLVTPDMKP